jgi:hypothetical protein
MLIRKRYVEMRAESGQFGTAASTLSGELRKIGIRFHDTETPIRIVF